ncbi:MAG TPA: DNA internalization-related competence protein ComEC/Rec2 [Myxococcota bacterium]|nr:DNA internalization-related competence protein ComEC/Rec2 [Myxococcota bacterium]
MLPALALAQALGIGIADRGWLSFDRAAVLGAALLAFGLAGSARARFRRASALAVALLAGAASLAKQLELAAAGAPLPRESLAVEGTLVALAAGPGWLRADLSRAVALDPRGAAIPQRIRISGAPADAGFHGIENALPGDRVRARVRLRAVREPRNPGSLPRVRRIERRGIGAFGRLVHPALHVVREDGSLRSPLRAIHERRRELSARIAEAGAGAELVRALALGDRAGLSNQQNAAFRELGLAHLLAVSGLHLGLVASLVFAGARLGIGRCAWLAARRDTRGVALWIAVAAGVAYALFSGWEIPVRRAFVMLLALALAIARGQSRRRAEPLAAAAIAVLSAEPGALFEPGAQLSFAATAALLYAAPRGADETASIGLAGWRRRIEDASRTSAVAVAVTAPIAAWQLGSAAPFAWLANLVAIPWFGAALLPLSLLAALALGCGLEVPGGLLLEVARRASSATLDAGLALAATLPAAAPATRPPYAILCCIGLCAGWTLWVRSTALRIAGALAVSALVALAPPAAVAPPPPRLVALEVDQGSATLIQGPSAAVLIDAGSAFAESDWGERAVVPALAALGVGRIDVLVVSHGDLDHRGGVPSVLEHVRVGEVWVPHGAASDPEFGAIARAATASRIPLIERGAGSPVVWLGELRIEALWPLRVRERRSRNDRSLVVRIDVAGRRILLPGDLELRAERDLVASGADVRADVLALSHHGSRTSSSEVFLGAVDAALAIASAPCGGRFDMPHSQALRRARAAGLPVWWTGRDGAVMVALAGPVAAWGFGERRSGAECAPR